MTDEEQYQFRRLVDENNWLKMSVRNLEDERHRLIEDIERYRDDILQMSLRLRHYKVPDDMIKGGAFK